MIVLRGIACLTLLTCTMCLNFMDYTNLYDGIVHLQRLKITGHETWSSADHAWKTWEFLGIRYATAERFQPPKFFDDYNLMVDHEKKSTVFSVPGPACMQHNRSTLLTALFLNQTSEDCLFLNIYLPPINRDHCLLKASKWPVLVYVHGDDFQGGAGHVLDGNELSRSMETLIVTVNYRTGLFGFLSSEDFNARGNWGLKDVKMALKWIHHYVGRFGGDPSKIVVSGSASGGAMVSFLMMDSEVREIISGAFIMSGSSLSHKSFRASPRLDAVELANSVGCGAIDTTENFIGCLREKTAEQLLAGDKLLGNKECDVPRWLPAVDGDMIPYNPRWVFRSNAWKFNGSILQGFDSTGQDYTKTIKVCSDGTPVYVRNDKSGLTVASVKMFTQHKIREFLSCNGSNDDLDEVLKFYSITKNSSTDALWQSVIQLSLDLDFRLAILQEASEYATNKHLLEDETHQQIFDLALNLSQKSSITPKLSQSATLDAVYLFGGSIASKALGPKHDKQITDQLRYLLGTLLKQGRGLGVPYDPSHPQILRLGISQKWDVVNDPALPQLVQFWDGLKLSACRS